MDLKNKKKIISSKIQKMQISCNKKYKKRKNCLCIQKQFKNNLLMIHLQNNLINKALMNQSKSIMPKFKVALFQIISFKNTLFHGLVYLIMR